MFFEDDKNIVFVFLSNENKSCVRWCYPPTFTKNLILGRYIVIPQHTPFTYLCTLIIWDPNSAMGRHLDTHLDRVFFTSLRDKQDQLGS